MFNPIRGRRRLVILAAVAAGLAAGAFLAMHYGIPYKRHREIQRRLEVFRADPSRETLSPLAEVMAGGPVRQGDAQDVARAVLGLKVVVAKSYIPGCGVDVNLVPRSEDLLRTGDPPDNDAGIWFLNWRAGLRIPGYPEAKGQDVPSDSSAIMLWPSANLVYEVAFRQAFPCAFKEPIPTEPGVYQGAVVFRAQVAATAKGAGLSAAILESSGGDYANVSATYVITQPPGQKPGLLDGWLEWLGLKDNPLRGLRTYPCEIEIPVEFRIEGAPDEEPAVQ